MSIIDRLVTAEEYALLPDRGRLTELVRGKVVEMNMPFPRHGQVCVKVAQLLANFSDQHSLGHVLSNDSGVITQRAPDTVRGADVAFYSYRKLPKGPLPTHYLDVVPDVVFQVRSPGDRWGELMTKVAEYLNAGVQTVCVVDPENETVHVQDAGRAPQTLTGSDELVLPIMASFRAPVSHFFA